MLKITKTVEYALIAIRHINHKNKLCSSMEISLNYNVPYEIMAKTLQRLCKTGYVYAIKGSQGGYYLKRSIDKVNLIEFIEDLEGPIGLVNCTISNDCDQIECCTIKSPLLKINNKIMNTLKNITLDEIR